MTVGGGLWVSWRRRLSCGGGSAYLSRAIAPRVSILMERSCLIFGAIGRDRLKACWLDGGLTLGCVYYVERCQNGGMGKAARPHRTPELEEGFPALPVRNWRAGVDGLTTCG